MIVLEIMTLLVTLFWVYIGILLIRGHRSIGFLKNVVVNKLDSLPSVTIIIPARNESRNIRPALQSILSQDYPNLEIIVVNDRSTDDTGAILSSMQASESRLKVLTISELPPGWLGKNHALQFGADHANSEILLFSDADILMHPDTVSRAVSWLIENNLDHLAITPEVTMPGHILGMVTLTFTIFFSLYAFPWKVSDPDSKKHIGIGGFNMIRSHVYRSIDGHTPIALCPDDDMKLGMLVKKHQFRQGVLFGQGMLSVEWYTSLKELIQGLMKNAFAGMEFQVTRVVIVTILMIIFFLLPYPALFINNANILLTSGVSVFIITLVCIDNARIQTLPAWYAIGFPMVSLLLIYILWRAMLLNLHDNGIYWRGTHYPLSDLKAKRIKW